jgi:multidrug efflux pump subunit AcrA (membrane-fusion protein)
MDVQTEHSSVGDNHRTAETSQDPHEAIPTDLPRLSNFAVVVAALVVVGCFAGLFALGWFPHQRRDAELTEHAQEMNELKPVVQVAAPQRTQAGQDLVLPADVRAMQETSIFPRANGYLKKLYVDIGDQVKSGQLLAEIDSPDIDAELAQAKAAQVQSQAQQTKAQDDLELAQATFKRYEAFSKTGGVTQQQFDEKQAALTQAQSVLAAATANVKAADANVQRLAALQGFEKVFAPFSGTITARNYDLGALMTPGGTPGRELFRIADVSTLRVFVNVPQTYVTALRTGGAELSGQGIHRLDHANRRRARSGDAHAQLRDRRAQPAGNALLRHVCNRTAAGA